MRYIVIALLLSLVPRLAPAESTGLDTRMPLVEEALRFLKDQALCEPSEAALLRSGALRVCGEALERPGCKPQGIVIPDPTDTSPQAIFSWRRILESILATESIRQKESFDKIAFERYVMDAMVEMLGDPGSFYIAPSVHRKTTSIPADFVGFGLQVLPQKDSLLVSAVHEGSPAAALGVYPGESVTAVNDQPVTGFYRPVALAALWGADGKTVKLSFQAEGGGQRRLEIVYKPWTFVPYTVKELEDQLLVVRVRYLARGLADEVARAMTPKIKAVEIDLRYATSGDEEELVKLADLFLGDGSVGGKKARSDLGTKNWSVKLGTPAERLEVPIVVAVNGNTSDLAEVFVSALKQHKRALLVGARTAGHAVRDTLRPFQDGSAIQLTTTRLLGPQSTPIDSGVAPDVVCDPTKAEKLARAVLRAAKTPVVDDLAKLATELAPKL